MALNGLLCADLECNLTICRRHYVRQYIQALPKIFTLIPLSPNLCHLATASTSYDSNRAWLYYAL